MAIGKKTGGRGFKVGNPGGPGRKKVPEDQKLAWEEIRKMQKVARHKFHWAFEKFLDMPFKELVKFVGDKDNPPNCSVVELLVARGILRITSYGKAVDIQTIMEVICGPQPKQLEVSGPDGKPIEFLAKTSTESLMGIFMELDRVVKEQQCKSTPKLLPSSPPSLESAPPLSDTQSVKE